MKYLILVVTLAVARAQFSPKHGSCQNRCFLANDNIMSCQCDSDCETHNSCCSDFWRRCRGTEEGLVVTQQELNTFAQSLWDNDVNRIDKALYSLDYQGQTNLSSGGDMATNSLIKPTDEQLDAKLASSSSTYRSFIQLLDNYELYIYSAEHRTLSEIQEENTFWKAASQTQVMQLTFQFLRDNGLIKSDSQAFRTVINELWFLLYSKSYSSHEQSGFETIMVGEETRSKSYQVPNGRYHIIGFNNWVRYYLEQKTGGLDYQGYLSYLQDPPIVTVNFIWNNIKAEGKTFFVGTSPEFDMALITVCGLARRNKPCDVTIKGQKVTLTVSVDTHQDVLQLTGVEIQFPSSTVSTVQT